MDLLEALYSLILSRVASLLSLVSLAFLSFCLSLLEAFGQVHGLHILQQPRQFSQLFSGGQSHPFEPAPGHSSGALETGDGFIASRHGGVHDSHILHFEQLLHQLFGGQFSHVSPNPCPGQGDVNEYA